MVTCGDSYSFIEKNQAMDASVAIALSILAQFYILFFDQSPQKQKLYLNTGLVRRCISFME
jgi:hypothetical protein